MLGSPIFIFGNFYVDTWSPRVRETHQRGPPQRLRELLGKFLGIPVVGAPI